MTYNFTQSGSPEVNTLTQYLKSPYFRQDISVTTGGPTATFSTFVRPDGTFTCGTLAGPAPSCYSFGGTAGLGAPQAPQVVPQDLTGYSFQPTTTRTVAGQEARCFSFSGAQAAGAEVIGCYTRDGIPVYLSSKAGGTEVVMTATTFSTAVTDADFALPYPVQKLPGQP